MTCRLEDVRVTVKELDSKDDSLRRKRRSEDCINANTFLKDQITHDI